MEQDGTWLSFVKYQYRTLEICVAAIKQTPNAIDFIPKHLFDEEPMYNIVLDPSMIAKNPYIINVVPKHVFTKELMDAVLTLNPDIIVDVPDTLLTQEMIYKSLNKNPNLIYLSKIKNLLGEYKDESIPLSIKRALSNTHTNQGEQGTCGRHAFSRVIVKNFFELILPLQAQGEREKDCSKFLKTYDIALEPDDESDSTLVNLEELTPQKCSFSGYIKILLFLHCFFLFQTRISTVYGRPKGWLECVQVSDLYKHFYTNIEIPKITHNQLHDLEDALHMLKTVQQKNGISLVTFHFKNITLDNIKKITDRGLYIMLRIESSSSKRNFHGAHFVIIVGAFKDYMLIKNSWGDDTIYKIKFGLPFYLGSYKYDILTDCSFVIPVIQKNNEDFGDLTHVDLYLQKYDELKTRFNSITVNVVNKSCPSKDKEPVGCDDIPFTTQETIFHPDKNPRCLSEATAKFQKLNNLCKKETNGLPLLIGRGTRKGKRKTRKRKKRIRSI